MKGGNPVKYGKNGIIRLICLTLTSAALATTGILYIISCIGIWKSGNMPFTRDSIGLALSKLIIPSTITVALIIAGAIIIPLFPVEKKKKSSTDSKDTRDILAKKITLSELSSKRGEAVVTERNKRFFLSAGGILILLLSLIYPIIYVLTPDNFGIKDINVDVLLAAAHVIISFIPLTVYSVISSYMKGASYAKESELLRGGIKEKGEISDFYSSDTAKIKPLSERFAPASAFLGKNKKTLTLIFKCTVLAVGVTFIVLGIFNGGMKDVLEKAVQICRECIGLG